MNSEFSQSETVPSVYSLNGNMICTDPIIISDHPKFRILFQFEYDNVDKSNLRGHFIFLRRASEKDDWPSETTFSRGDIKSGEKIDFELKSDELSGLFHQIQAVNSLLKKLTILNIMLSDNFFLRTIYGLF